MGAAEDQEHLRKKKGSIPPHWNLMSGKDRVPPPSLDFILLGRKLGPRKFHPLCRNHLTSEWQSSFCISLLLTPILGFFSRRKGTHRLIHTKQPFYFFNKFIKYLLCAIPVWSLAIVLNNKEEPSASLKFTSQLGRQIPDSQFRIQRQVQYSRGDWGYSWQRVPREGLHEEVGFGDRRNQPWDFWRKHSRLKERPVWSPPSPTTLGFESVFLLLQRKRSRRATSKWLDISDLTLSITTFLYS